MNNRIYPNGLKGNQITDRMKELMGVNPIKEDAKTSVIELTKKGPDGKVYGIVRENHEYYIKVTDKKSEIISEDFSYIGGLKNKKDYAYPSYAKAIKHLNLKFNSLNEAYGKSGQINVFESDHLEEAKSTCCNATIKEGVCSECNKSIVQEEEVQEVEIAEEELTEVEQAVEDMMEEEIPTNPEDPKEQPGFVHEKRLSIAIAINEMDNIIDDITRKKKVYTLK